MCCSLVPGHTAFVSPCIVQILHISFWWKLYTIYGISNAVWCCCVMPLRLIFMIIIILWTLWTMQWNVRIEYCSQVSCLHRSSLFPSFCCYTLCFSLPFQQSNCNQKGPASYSDMCWFNLHLHNHWHALICIRWTQSESRKMSSRGNQFLGVQIKGGRSLISKAMKCEWCLESLLTK